jgi:hypothetical protein
MALRAHVCPREGGLYAQKRVDVDLDLFAVYVPAVVDVEDLEHSGAHGARLHGAAEEGEGSGKLFDGCNRSLRRVAGGVVAADGKHAVDPH